MNEKVFKDDELSKFYVFSNKKLPTVNDCLLYVLSRTNKDPKRSQTRQQIIWELANIVEDVWNKGDCCPYTRKHIVTLSGKNVLDIYIYIYIYIYIFPSFFGKYFTWFFILVM